VADQGFLRVVCPKAPPINTISLCASTPRPADKVGIATSCASSSPPFARRDRMLPGTMGAQSLLDVQTSSFRNRRQSNIEFDAIHEVPADGTAAPAQLYTTESGRLFHSGKIAIVTVGLPARGKTHVSVSLSRYLRWLGVKTRAFHLGDYRRAHLGPKKDVPHDYFFVNASAESVKLRQTILQKCRMDLYHFLDHEHGQVAIYDAVNPLSEGRKQLAKEFAKHDIQTIFIESYVDDQSIIEDNVRRVKISSPDVCKELRVLG